MKNLRVEVFDSEDDGEGDSAMEIAKLYDALDGIQKEEGSRSFEPGENYVRDAWMRSV